MGLSDTVSNGDGKALALPEAERAYVGLDHSLSGLPQKEWLDRHVGARRYALRSNDMQITQGAARQGWGIAFLPCFAVARDDVLFALDLADPPPALPVYLVMHGDLRKSPRVRKTADCLVDMFARDGGELNPPINAGPEGSEGQSRDR